MPASFFNCCNAAPAVSPASVTPAYALRNTARELPTVNVVAVSGAGDYLDRDARSDQLSSFRMITGRQAVSLCEVPIDNPHGAGHCRLPRGGLAVPDGFFVQVNRPSIRV